MMGSLYGNVRKIVPDRGLIPKPGFVFIDEWNFRLHYRATAIMIWIAVAMITFSEYFGSRIKCLPVTLGTKVVVTSKFLETYCFISPTFTVHPLNNTGGHESDKYAGGPQHIPGKTTAMEHGYYTWIPFVLWFNAILFYAPHYLWKLTESERLKNILQRLHVMSLEMEPAAKSKAINILGKYLWDSRNVEKGWGYAYVFFEYLNLIVLMVNVYATQLVLDGHFYMYGIDRIREFNEDENEIALIASARKLFPTISKCLFRNYGASGNVQILSTICILPMNVVNEKVFTFIWIWYIVLGVLTVGFLIYRTVTLLSFEARRASLTKVSYLLTTTKCTRVMEKLGISGWILLKLISLNLEPNIFQRVLLRVHDEFMETGGTGDTEEGY